MPRIPVTLKTIQSAKTEQDSKFKTHTHTHSAGKIATLQKQNNLGCSNTRTPTGEGNFYGLHLQKFFPLKDEFLGLCIIY